MKKTIKHIGACMLGLTVLTVASCTDTWDEHYESVSGSVATRTLWDIISTTPEMSNFAKLAESVPYYRDEKHPQADYSYRRMLDGTQLITVWVPTNDALSEAEWNEWFELAETSPYTVQQKLLANSIALWRQVASSAGVDTITLLNGKKQAFDKTNATMAGIPMTTKNTAAVNGTLHTLGEPIPFAYNLYEYLKDKANAEKNGITQLYEFIMDNDTTYFSEEGSIEGIPDADGMPTYIDSAYVTSNNLFYNNFRFPTNLNTDQYDTHDEGFGANISAEDSSFVMILPTDKAMEDAVEMLKPYYIYADEYADTDKGNNATYVTRKVAGSADSLVEKNIKMDLLTPLVFNTNLQPNASERIGLWNIKDLINNADQAPYLRNTFGDTLRSDDGWNKQVLFEGKEKVAMSNGYGILTDTWNFPAKFYKPDVVVEARYDRIWNFGRYAGQSWGNIGFSNEVAKNWVDTVGRVSNDNFLAVYPRAATQPTQVEFILRGSQQETQSADVMSGKYDIYVVLVPSFYVTSTDSIYGDTLKTKITGTINYNLRARQSSGAAQRNDFEKLNSKPIEFSGQKVDTILLREDFEFKYSYKNLLHSYPTIHLQTTTLRNSDIKNGYTNTLYIDRIILKSKD